MNISHKFSEAELLAIFEFEVIKHLSQHGGSAPTTRSPPSVAEILEGVTIEEAGRNALTVSLAARGSPHGPTTGGV